MQIGEQIFTFGGDLVAGAVPVGQGDVDHGIDPVAEQGLELADALGVGPIALPDGDGPGVEPDDVAAFEPAGAVIEARWVLGMGLCVERGVLWFVPLRRRARYQPCGYDAIGSQNTLVYCYAAGRFLRRTREPAGGGAA